MASKQRGGEDNFKPLAGVLSSVLPEKASPIDLRLRRMRQELAEMAAPDVLYQHAVLCQVPMPYKATAERRYHHQQGDNHLWITAGEVVDENNAVVDLPLPYGPMARLISYHLVSEIKRHEHKGTLQTDSSGLVVLEIAPSMTAFALQMGVRNSGPGLEQFKRCFAAYCAAHWAFGRKPAAGGVVQLKANIVEAFNVWFPKNASQRILWKSELYLNPLFVESVKRRSVPLARAAIIALQSSALALDVYSWLAHRLQYPDVRERGGVFIPWAALKEQFGPKVARMTHFREELRRALKMVLGVYPGARIAEEFRKGGQPAGLRLRASPPPIKGSIVALPSGGNGA